MTISSITGYQSTSYVTTSPIIRKRIPQSSDNLFANGLGKAVVENKTVQNQKIYEELSQEYDIHNSTFDQLCEITHKLYEDGEISAWERSIMIFPYDSLTREFNKPSLYLTPVSPDGKRDWIAEYEEKLKRDAKVNPQNCELDYRLLQVLKNLDK